jgi:kinesin family protein 15
VYVENLSEVEVESVQDVVRLLLLVLHLMIGFSLVSAEFDLKEINNHSSVGHVFQGAMNRKVAATNLNGESSRSHSVFTCIIQSKVWFRMSFLLQELIILYRICFGFYSDFSGLKGLVSGLLVE